MGARRATDMRHNQRVYLPQARSASEEAVLCSRMEVWKRAASKYTEEHCLPGGVQKSNNLTAQERIGLSKLKKQVKAGEITILPADKGNRFTVSSQDSYCRQGDTHTLNDRKVTKQEVQTIQTRMNTLSRSLAKVVGLGSNSGPKNEARCWQNIVSESCVSPNLYPSPKTHKLWMGKVILKQSNCTS